MTYDKYRGKKIPVLNVLRQSAHEGGKVVSPMHQLPLPPQKIFLVLISVIEAESTPGP
jgi:hypothetical protein